MAKWQKIAEDDWLKGLNEAIDNIQKAVDKIQHGSVEGLKDALLYVATESQDKAPVDTGDLRGSVLVEIDDMVIAKGKKEGGIEILVDPPENGTVGTVSYNTPYADVQHEHTEFDHPKGGQAKYLEIVLTSEKDRILELIAGGIIDELEE